jgi:hypothetical protein
MKLQNDSQPTPTRRGQKQLRWIAGAIIFAVTMSAMLWRTDPMPAPAAMEHWRTVAPPTMTADWLSAFAALRR